MALLGGRGFLAATAAALMGIVSAQVDCGGHIADNCGNCPLDQDSGMNYGEAWCNGECKWIDPHWFGIHGNCLNQNIQENTGGILNEYGFTFTLSAFITLIFACVYKSKVVNKLPELPPRKNPDLVPREKSIFTCFTAPETCLYSTCCLPIVAGKNYHAAEVCNFWAGCILIFVGTYTPCLYLFTAMIRAALAGRVRDRLGHKTELCKDCCLSLFCFPCEVARESLEIDEALHVKIGCCYPHLEVEPREQEESLVEEALEELELEPPSRRMCGLLPGQGH